MSRETICQLRNLLVAKEMSFIVEFLAFYLPHINIDARFLNDY
jgi:hypothetical protein